MPLNHTRRQMFLQAFSVIFNPGISAIGYGIEVVDGINTIKKRFPFQLISTVQLPGEKGYDTKMVIHNVTQTYDASLSKE